MSYCPDCAEKDKLIREQRDEIARLTAAQSESCTDAKEEAMGCYRAVKAERERDAAMKDAERVQWVEDNYPIIFHIEYDGDELEVCSSVEGVSIGHAFTFRAAIDAAIAKEKG